ncbi:UbiD family decarboxylase [Candidatus Micrarchaeota archaeon]|nr:UbiD family decarboxylase [Candidatus Micrarchaeota archaeon]
MRTFRDFIEQLKENDRMAVLKRPVSRNLDLAGLMHSLEGRPVFAPEVKDSDFAAVGNVFSTRELISDYLGISKGELVPLMVKATENPEKPELVETGPVLENTDDDVNLHKLPIPVHAERDGGPYISSAVVIAQDRELGRNLSFHRMMVIGNNKVVMRILPRHLHEFIERAGGVLEVAFVVGAPINVLLSAAVSSRLGQDELEYANALAPVKTVRLGNGIEVPAHCEFAFEGRITREMHDEGPFIDLTGTYDIVRKQPVMEISRMHHRNNALWHVLLPGGLEHKVLMGMPREPTIFNEINSVCECRGVNITPGGCSWLHAAVSIKKKSEEDGKKAIEAAFAGHKSLKHVVIVDEDIDVDDIADVEWAVATRFQADRDLVVKENQKGSSLDPSADPETRKTTKMGLDATMPLEGKTAFEKAEWKKVDARDYR